MPVCQRTDRQALLSAVRWFLNEARHLDEVLQIALIGSVCTNKKHPKDIDLLITVKPGSDLKRLATLRRKTQGRIQQGLLGTDMFIVDTGEYIGRLCRYREPHPRVSCCDDKLVCDSTKTFLCDTSRNFVIPQSLVDYPTIILYPEFSAPPGTPDDVLQIFGLS
jgi:predicted nucleotidyltransferase